MDKRVTILCFVFNPNSWYRKELQENEKGYEEAKARALEQNMELEGEIIKLKVDE